VYIYSTIVAKRPFQRSERNTGTPRCTFRKSRPNKRVTVALHRDSGSALLLTTTN
jgi:hypothetical protein